MCTTIIGRFGVNNDNHKNRSHSTPSAAHDSPSSYISATEIPLPEDAMEDDNCLSAMERELGSQHQSLNDICDQLITLIALSGGVNPRVEAPPAVANAVVAPLNPLNTNTHRLKPATPSEFTGDHTKGCAFLNSCDLYIGLGPYPVRWWSSKDLLGPLFYERWSCCALHWLNHVTCTANGIAPMGDLGWLQTRVHMWLLPKKRGPNGSHGPGDLQVPSRLPFCQWVHWQIPWTSGSCRVHWRCEHCAEVPTWAEPHHTELHCLSHLWLTFQWYPQGLVWCCDPLQWKSHCKLCIPIDFAIHLNHCHHCSWSQSQPCHRGYQTCTLCSSPCDICDSIYWIHIKATTRPQCNGCWCDLKMRPKSSSVLLMREDWLHQTQLSWGVQCSHHDCGRTFRLHPAWARCIGCLHNRHRSIKEVEEVAQGETSVESGFTSHDKWIVRPHCNPRIILHPCS